MAVQAKVLRMRSRPHIYIRGSYQYVSKCNSSWCHATQKFPTFFLKDCNQSWFPFTPRQISWNWSAFQRYKGHDHKHFPRGKCPDPFCCSLQMHIVCPPPSLIWISFRRAWKLMKMVTARVNKGVPHASHADLIKYLSSTVAEITALKDKSAMVWLMRIFTVIIYWREFTLLFQILSFPAVVSSKMFW